MKQCMPFYFGGVDGNPNRFTTREHVSEIFNKFK